MPGGRWQAAAANNSFSVESRGGKGGIDKREESPFAIEPNLLSFLSVRRLALLNIHLYQEFPRSLKHCGVKGSYFKYPPH